MNVKIDDDKPMNIKQVREYLGLSRDKTDALFHQEDFPCISFGRYKVVMKNDLDDWLRRHRYTNIDLVA